MTAIEFSILAAPFFFLVFAMLETALIFLSGIALDQAVDRAARLVRTGEAARLSMTAPQFRDEICDSAVIITTCSDVHVDLRSLDSYRDIPKGFNTDSGSLDSSDFLYNMGGSGELASLRVAYGMPLYTSVMHRFFSNLDGGAFLITSATAFEIEPFNEED